MAVFAGILIKTRSLSLPLSLFVSLFVSLFFFWDHSEPEKVFEGLEIVESTKEELLNNIKRRLTPQPIKIRADIEVTCFDYEGIDAIKAAFKEAEAVSLEDVPIRVKLVAPPLYVMITNALDKQLGIDTMEKAISVLEESIKKANGNMVTKMSVRPFLLLMKQSMLKQTEECNTWPAPLSQT